jgi:hypothetical protein
MTINGDEEQDEQSTSANRTGALVIALIFLGLLVVVVLINTLL